MICLPVTSSPLRIPDRPGPLRWPVGSATSPTQARYNATPPRAAGNPPDVLPLSSRMPDTDSRCNLSHPAILRCTKTCRNGREKWERHRENHTHSRRIECHGREHTGYPRRDRIRPPPHDMYGQSSCQAGGSYLSAIAPGTSSFVKIGNYRHLGDSDTWLFR